MLELQITKEKAHLNKAITNNRKVVDAKKLKL